MNPAFDGQAKEQGDIDEDELERLIVDRRRLLLRGAASGLSLAASGLFLPDWFAAEVEAREGSTSGALGGRHGKNHKGRHRRRHRDRKRHNNHGAPGKGPFRNVQFTIYNGQSSPQDVQVWVLTEDKNLNSLYTVKWSDRLAPGETREYKSEELYLLVTRPDYQSNQGGPIFAQGFNNPIYYPALSFGGVPSGFSGYRDELHENTINIMKVGTNVSSFGFKGTRLEDTDYIRFRIELTAP